MPAAYNITNYYCAMITVAVSIIYCLTIFNTASLQSADNNARARCLAVADGSNSRDRAQLFFSLEAGFAFKNGLICGFLAFREP